MKPFLPALIVALAVLARLVPGPRTIDDAFITFRYARNLLAGQGFTFNPGEAVLGTTTPLYTLLMAGLGALTGGTQAPFPLLALLVNALADAATCLLLWHLGRRLGFERAGVAAALAWAVAPFSVTFAIGGLETSLYVALLTGAVAAAIAAHPSPRPPSPREGGENQEVRGDFVPSGDKISTVSLSPLPLRGGAGGGVGSTPKPAARSWRTLEWLLASLALLTRPDALILLGPLAVERLWSAWRRREAIRWPEVAAAVLPYGAWAVAAALMFGSPLPHSILAKAAAYRLDSGEALVRLIQHYATPFMEQNLLGAPLAVGFGLLAYPFLFLLGARRALKTRPPAALWAWLLYPWLYLVTFALPNPLIFRWYLTPPLPAYFFFIFIGLEVVLETLARWWGRRSRRGQAAPEARPGPAGWIALVLLLPVLVSMADWRLAPDHGPAAPAPEMAFIKLELLYRQAADRIAPQMTGQTLLAAGDVGVLGFYTPARILDTVGLNSAVSTGYYPLPAADYVINYAIPTDLLLDQQPDWIVVLEVYGRKTFLAEPRFQSKYELVQKIATDMYGSDGMLVFKKR